MGHYYGKDGTPEHFRGPNGSATTLREARKLGLLPSCTEILNIIAKPQLEEWKRKQTMIATAGLSEEDRARLLAVLGKIASREASEQDVDWHKSVWKRVEREAAQKAADAAEEGKAIHAAIEASFASEDFPARFRPHVSAVHQILSDNFPGVRDWSIEHRFACADGYGGQIDIHSRTANAVGDHKGVEVAPDEKKQLAYSQHWQLGGYAHGIKMPSDCRGFNLFISRTHPGHVRFHEWTAAQMQTGRQVFLDTLRLWKSIKGYDGGF